ncbi:MULTISPECIES: fimbria/pilus outer membrane usher protein [unclassified Pseudomonas]|uniref:fimbria/pilus outer membrane usher protein n=1 Tax=unclassified Pseudomonas TaxID=196821 RepID=UPI001912E978|nr:MULTISPECIES: fimbria/pilus outer membrane usher protein [unclassified Pseudomonas]MBK5512840.1 fimbrial biogenesis outer membrane usher protein [Pseudomonas sp. TH15]MBK5553435.1 fimbrial biogenesis outer membrane usher protein [Pseudomonas sp. TH03]MEB0224829.1 fimbria/pilus outer membrane usher protein [Pseudomonas sp. 5S1]MEB0297187.1 fimbria/pilus outer membrane usher protein [Pseudomonas sp. 10S4]WPX18078.1 fimbria/pilus outer membrane usher protein [Pseudomonas sp. 10S4]
MSQRWARSFQCPLWAATCACWLVIIPLAEAGDLPPPPSGMEAVADAQLFLELVVNQMNTGRVVAVDQRGGRFFLPASALRDSGMKLPENISAEVDLDSLPGLHSEYDSVGQRLLLNVPPDWLPEQFVGNRQAYPRTPALSSFGALLNYDLYLNDTDDAGTYLAAWNEVRLFDSWGTLSNTGQYRRTLSGEAVSTSNNGYLRYDTTWRYSDDERLLTYEAGDLVSGALPWSSSVRLGGVQLSRDFGVRPDLVTYPLPQFAGEAAVPSSVDLFINGYKSSSADLQPGPYTLTNIPFINGAGEAVVVTTDALGRQVSTTVPFYVTSSLLQKGLSDFSVAAGTLRRDYGLRDFGYGPGVTSGSLRYGLSDNFTLESHAEASDSLTLGGLGGNLRLGNFGVLNTALSQSQFDGESGQQLSLGYQYSSQRYSFSYQRMQRRDQYADLTVIDTPYTTLSKRSEQATLSLNLDSWGSLGVGYFDVRAADESRTRLLNLTWSKPLWRDTSFYLSGNREIGDSNWAVQAQLVIPFDLHGSLAISSERSKTGQTQQRVNYSRAVPTEGGVGFNLGYAQGDAPTYRQADLTWRLQSVQLQAGVYGTSEAETRWADASGSLVWMDRQLFAANRIDDAFVVVSTDGYADIPVRYENQLVGQTDRNGHLLVPWSSAYYRGKYEIDPLNLPANVRSPNVEQRIAVRRGSGYLLEFPLSRIVAASIVLVDARQQELPLGSGVVHEQSGTQTVVGWDGLVYLENLQAQNSLRVTLADGKTCQVQFAVDMKQDQIPLIGPLVCK